MPVTVNPMKITCQRESLTAAFSLAASVAPSRSPKEILQNVKVTATGGKTVLTATDQEVGIRIDLVDTVEIGQEGTALLPVQRTMAILRESTDETLEIETDDSGVRIQGSRTKYRLPGSNPDEFPSVTGFEEEKYHALATRLFREMIRRTVFATDMETSRYALGGVLLEMEESRITAVGTDGRRLAKMEGTGESIGGHQTSGTTTIVPTRAIQLIERALHDEDETVDVAARTNDPTCPHQASGNLCKVGGRPLPELATGDTSTREYRSPRSHRWFVLCGFASSRYRYRSREQGHQLHVCQRDVDPRGKYGRDWGISRGVADRVRRRRDHHDHGSSIRDRFLQSARFGVNLHDRNRLRFVTSGFVDRRRV